MKGWILICMCMLAMFCSQESTAQVRLGVKGGLSTMEEPTSVLHISDERGVDKYNLKVDNAKYGIHLGLFVQAVAGHFFAQPELLFNTVTVDYAIEDLQMGNARSVRDEIYRNLDIPVILGAKFGPVRIGGGPVGHIFLDSTSDLQDLGDFYKQDKEVFSYGWQAGIGLDLWKLHLDARYEGNFADFGDHMVFYGKKYAFSESPSRLLVSAGISF